jgi:hypothetical protein
MARPTKYKKDISSKPAVVLKGKFGDVRTDELYESLTDFARSKCVELQLTYYQLIGVLEAIKIDFHVESKNG